MLARVDQGETARVHWGERMKFMEDNRHMIQREFRINTKSVELKLGGILLEVSSKFYCQYHPNT